ncbi:hypothetical protein SLS60_009073 [Paraconiothyrium brasiliense]|uniref:MARVEL domain-containing protein n=1 Tax=Paraconiothyrium brasiliense TaxID=300254 RepID=A0ABR3QXC5_9PLEO
MPVPSYGAMPLSKTFLLVRIMQVIAMVVIIGITSNFIGNIVNLGVEPPKEFVGTIAITCIAALYILVSVAYYWSEANLGLLVMAGADSLLLIAFIVVAVTVGKPVSYLNCYVIGKTSSEVDAAYAYAFTTSVKNNLNQMGDKLSLGHWAGVTKSNCFQAKTVWGLAIAMW